MTTRALVLGGGGLTGIAWETGVLAAWMEHGVDVLGADRIVGTSAGATVAAQLSSGLPLPDLLDRQISPSRQSHELVPDPDAVAKVMDASNIFGAELADRGAFARQTGELALGAQTVAEADRRAVIASRLPEHAWPAHWPADKLWITAVDARSGEPRFFTVAAGAPLVDAVAASCAVPGVWPPVTIGGSRYMDGGVRSAANADLAAGYDRVVILAPISDGALAEQVDALAAAAQVKVIVPDEDSVAAFGANPLNPAVRTPAAQAGYRQGQATASSVATIWTPE